LEFFYFGLCGDIFPIDCKNFTLKTKKTEFFKFRLINWCQREAYLRVALRESLGQSGVSPRHVDPAKV
jgi:hypothetical protein